MSYRILVGIAVVALSGGAIEAQKTTPSASQAQTKRDPKLLTVTGCLEQGNPAGTFLLTKVPDPLVDSVAAAGGGAIPTVTYQLSGGQNLAPHLGHKIEVTGQGTLKPQTPVKVIDAETKRTTGTKGASTNVKEKAAVAVRPLTVASFRMVSTDCSAK